MPKVVEKKAVVIPKNLIKEKDKPKKPTEPAKPVLMEPAPVVAPQPKPEKREVFRLFECLIHLEQAVDHINKVGIFPGKLAEQLMKDQKDLLQRAVSMRRTYTDLWANMQSEASK